MTSCAAQWCVGMSLEGGLAAQRRDGTAYVRAGNVGILDSWQGRAHHILDLTVSTG